MKILASTLCIAALYAPVLAEQTTAPAAIATKLEQASLLLQKRATLEALRPINEALVLAPEDFEALLFQALAQYLQDNRTSRMQASVVLSSLADRPDPFPTTPRFVRAAKAVCAVVDPGGSATLSLKSLQDGMAALYYQREGEMLLLQKSSGTAEMRLRQAIEARPERSSLHALLAEALAQQGKAAEAGKSRTEATRLLAKNPAGDLKPSPAAARAWADSEEGDAAFFAKDYRKAVASYARAESAFVRDPRFLGSYGQSFEELARSGVAPQENFDKAIALFEKYDALEPGNASLLDLLARALLSRAELTSESAKSASLRERARVVSAKKQALTGVPTAEVPTLDPAALRKQGDAALATKRWVDAIAAYEKARPAFEKDAMFLDALGDAHYYLGKEKVEPQKHFSEAQKIYEAATRIKPGTSFLWEHLGHAWEEMGELENAIVAYQKSVALSGVDPWVHRALGGVMYKLKRYPEAELRLREAVRIKPNTEEFYNELGMACVAQTKWREAEAAYREAFRVNKNNPAYPNNIAAALVRQGKPEEARPFAEQARRLKLSGDTPAPKKLVFKNGAQLLNALLEMQKNIQDVNSRSASTRALKNILTNVEALESKGNSKVIRKISSDSLKEVLPEFFGLFLTKQEFALVSLTTLNTFPKVAERPADSLAKLVREVRTLKANFTVLSKDNEPSPLEYALRDIEMQGKTWPDKERGQVEKALKDLLQVLQDAMQVSEAARDWVERSS